MAQTSSFVI